MQLEFEKKGRYEYYRKEKDKSPAENLHHKLAKTFFSHQSSEHTVKKKEKEHKCAELL